MKNFVILFLLVFVSQFSISQNISFNQASGSPITNTSNQRGLISRDINADGKKDLLIANLYNNTIRVLLGNGSGQFTDAPGSPISIMTGPIYIAVADFNGDSKLDLATANYNSNNVTILIGNGSGSFSISSTVSTGNYPYSIDAADFNLDGNADLVTCNVNSNDVYILLGNGAGGFAVSGTPLSAGGMPYHVVSGKLNSDNFPDFAVANGSGNSVGVYLGNGLGGFNAVVNYPVGSQPRTITLKDLNTDGYLDMVVPNGVSNNISVLLGSATGVFTQALNSPFNSGGFLPYQSAVADFNSDGNLDIATSNSSSYKLSVLTGNGSGNFNAAGTNTLSLSADPQPAVTEDFNGDGKPDLAIGHWSSNTIYIYLNSFVLPCNLVSNFSYTSNSSGMVNFTNLTTGTVAATSYTWNFGDMTTASVFQLNHLYFSNGTYTVTLTASNNANPACISTFTQVVTVSIAVPCNLQSLFSYTLAPNGLVNFTNLSTGTVAATSYTWNFGDLTTATSIQPFHAYALNGTYTVTLMASNNATPSCKSTSSQVISIHSKEVGITELESNNKILVFPNPSKGLVYIESLTAQLKEFILYDSFGQEKLRIKLSSESEKIDISSLPNGIYFYRLLSDVESLKSSQLILSN